MANNQNPVIHKQITDGLKLNQLAEEVPTKVANSIVPVFEVNEKKKINYIANAIRTTSGSAGVATPNVVGKNYFLTNVQASYIKDATCDIATGNMGLTVQMADSINNLYLHNFPVITTTLQTGVINLHFPIPIPLWAGTIVALGGTYSLGVMSRCINVQGYFEDA